MTISHPYTAAGTYIVVLTVTDSNGNTGYDSVTIKVNAAGVPSTITLLASPNPVTPGGGNSLITATVKDGGGNPVTNGTNVTFSATLGSLTFTNVLTVSGIATTTLTLTNPSPSTVTISSTVGAISGTANANIVVSCPPIP
jgi:PKD repeat protein